VQNYFSICSLYLYFVKLRCEEQIHFRGFETCCRGPSWSYGNQCLSPLMLWVRTPLRRGVLDRTLCDKVCRWRVDGFHWILRFPPPIKICSSHLNLTKYKYNEQILKCISLARCSQEYINVVKGTSYWKDEISKKIYTNSLNNPYINNYYAF
jgi:hypothetical protein